jgi:hypothetical protein
VPKKFSISQEEKERILSLHEQSAAIMGARLPGALRTSTRGLKGQRTSSRKTPNTELEGPENDTCLLEPIERIQSLLSNAKQYPKSSSDIQFSLTVGVKLLKELRKNFGGDFLNILKTINTKGKLKSVIDYFEENKTKSKVFENKNLFEWIKNNTFLNKEDVVEILETSFDLPYCKKGCKCPIS